MSDGTLQCKGSSADKTGMGENKQIKGTIQTFPMQKLERLC